MTTLSPNERIEKIAEFTQKRLIKIAEQRQDEIPNLNPDYRWQHILRVCNYGKLLAEAEGGDVELAIAGCLLHDIAVFDLGDSKDHGRLGAKICRPFLEQLGYSPEQVDNICYSVASHVDETNPMTLEAKIVTDADNIDRFGAYRAFLRVLKDMSDYPNLISNLISRIQTLKQFREQNLLETPTGNTMFNEQLDFQTVFFEALIKENDWTFLPKI